MKKILSTCLTLCILTSLSISVGADTNNLDTMNINELLEFSKQNNIKVAIDPNYTISDINKTDLINSILPLLSLDTININENDINVDAKTVLDNTYTNSPKRPDGVIKNKTAYMSYNGTHDLYGSPYSYSLTVKIPYQTYEDASGFKSITSVNDYETISYLANNITIRKYTQTDVWSTISANQKEATIQGRGDATTSSGPVTSSRKVGFNVKITPNSGS